MRLLCTLLLLVSMTLVRSAPAATVLVLGDSLSAGYGIDADQGWVNLLAQRLGAEHHVVNASISGDTTYGGLSRLARTLELHEPDVVIVELGGNDGLRGLALREIRSNLSLIIARCLAARANVLLVGMRIPPNMGPIYTSRFHGLYEELAREHAIVRVPFLLDGVATVPSIMQADGIHPKAAGQPRMLENVWPYLVPLLVSPGGDLPRRAS